MKDYCRNKYNINNLILAKLNESVINTPSVDSIFILNRHLIDVGYPCLSRYTEWYKECLLGIIISEERSSSTPFTDLPKPIKEAYPFPIEYCTEEELNKGYISDIRLYQIFQEINMNRELTR